MDAACDDVKKSDRLRSMFGVILKLGNKLNDGGDQVSAFTLDSLLKLKDAKAFDQKTTIMQYLVRLIQRHEKGHNNIHTCALGKTRNSPSTCRVDDKLM